MSCSDPHYILWIHVEDGLQRSSPNPCIISKSLGPCGNYRSGIDNERMSCSDPHYILWIHVEDGLQRSSPNPCIISKSLGPCGLDTKRKMPTTEQVRAGILSFCERPIGRWDFDQQVTAGGFEPPTLRAEI